jgi:hypothetical protein
MLSRLSSHGRIHAPVCLGILLRSRRFPRDDGDRDPVDADDGDDRRREEAEIVRERPVQGAAEQVAEPVTDSEEQRERNEHGQPPAHDRADRDARDQAVGT